MIQWLRDHIRSTGQSMVEFALILVLVACVAIVTIAVAGNELNKTFTDIQEAVTNPSDVGQSGAYTCPDGTTAILHGHKYHCQ
jgi:Flp pilus assembly pilin Flp